MDNIYFTVSLIVITIIFIGFFAGIEIAFVTANKLSIELKKKQGKLSGIILSRFMEEPAKFIGTCLIGVNFFLVIYGLLVSNLLRPLWDSFHITNNYVILVVDTIISTLLILFFGEFIPKAIFRARNDALLSFFAPVAKFFYRIFFPVASILVTIAEWILKYVFNVRVHDRNEAFGKGDLEHFYQQNKDQDEENQELNTELFENALSLPMVKIRQCLVPRTEVEGFDIKTSVAVARQHMIETRLSKLVIYNDNIDNILGYIHQLDLFKNPADLQSILLPIPAVPESMSATDLINKFTKERKSIAWVVDEFGGTAGIVTMEDVLEEIFGEIKDEYDVEEFVEKQVGEDEYIFSGRLEIDYLNEKYDLDVSVSESETLSGFIISNHEAIPQNKERIIIDMFEFEILSVSDTRIEMVKMKVLR
ncbi:hemolysin family protein [Segetibacter sp.]|jgi:putative hemolysin|uniref:hemolysin family protein n=1 Tax=Segetibacter sp. TaxID=2231182 RepID=UPI002627DC0F|nr:hemolysin family protein [Segetibacter sp.]MCW3081386.1 HlyC/CorC family transporter [Segetibacter sp.]